MYKCATALELAATYQSRNCKRINPLKIPSLSHCEGYFNLCQPLPYHLTSSRNLIIVSYHVDELVRHYKISARNI